MPAPKGQLVSPVGEDPSGFPLWLQVDANGYLKIAVASWLEGEVDVNGYDGSVWRPLLVDTSGRPIVVGTGTSGEVPVSLAAPARGLVGEHGWIGGAWQKNPLLLGYSAQKIETLYQASMPAGLSQQNGATVPAGEIWVATNATVVYIGTVPTYAQFHLVSGGTIYPVFRIAAPASGVIYDRQGLWIAKEGDNFGGEVSGATLNDDFSWTWFGYRVDIDQ